MGLLKGVAISGEAKRTNPAAAVIALQRAVEITGSIGLALR